MRPVIQRRFLGLLLCAACAAACAAFSSCSRLGWGVLLWSTEEPPIPSGTILPVRIRSNIDKVWVVGIPSVYRKGSGGLNRMEIPLSRFELAGSKKKARMIAESFAPYTLTYAENMQDGLPVRADPDNSARRLYRLRTGEIVKILAQVFGNPAISASGDPLPGEWYQVLTADGTTGYCFSYRLRFFEYLGGTLAAAPTVMEMVAADPELDMLMSKVWSPESYAAMIESRRINIEELSRRWRFDPGQDTGIAHIYLPDLDRIIPYTGIRPDGERSWLFEGSTLRMSLRSDTTLTVQFTENGGGGGRTLLFTALSADVDDLLMQENARREGLYNAIYSQGPVFTSNNYGTIVFRGNGGFSWNGFELLVPTVISETAAGRGTVVMDIVLSNELAERYHGAFSFHFAGHDGREADTVRFLYILDNQVFRLEMAPETGLDGMTVARRAASPVALYFYKDDSLATLLSRTR